MPAKATKTRPAGKGSGRQSRDTTSGERFSLRLESHARGAKASPAREQVVGMRPGNSKKHRVDVLLFADGPKQVLVSAKYQGSRGTAEEKLCYEVLSLAKLLREDPERFPMAVMVLGGRHAWSLRDWYLSDEFREEMMLPDNLLILTPTQYKEHLRAGVFHRAVGRRKPTAKKS